MSELRKLQRLLREAQAVVDRAVGEEAEEMARVREENRLQRLASYTPRIVEGPVGTGDNPRL